MTDFMSPSMSLKALAFESLAVFLAVLPADLLCKLLLG